MGTQGVWNAGRLERAHKLEESRCVAGTARGGAGSRRGRGCRAEDLTPDLREKAAREREERILHLLPLVKRMAMQMRERLPLHIELDDLVSAGVLGLVDAVGKFDRHKDVKLESYARHRIRGAILDGLRTSDQASRDMRKKEKRAERVYRTLEAVLGRSPGNQEMAGALGLTLAKWYRTVSELRAVGFDWLRPANSVGLKEFSEPASESLPAEGAHNQFELCLRREQRDLLDRALKRLPERDQEIVKLYYQQDLTMRQIGCRLGIDESRVSQLHASALARLRLRVNEMLSYPRPAPPQPAW